MKKFAKVFSMMLVVALAAVMFTGCVLTAEKATEKLKKKEYTVVSTTDSGLASAGLKVVAELLKAENIVSGTKADEGETVFIVYFKEKDDAKKVAEDKKSLMEALDIEESKEDEIVMKQSGNAVVISTKKAVGIVA